jgi:hypothetical protein
MPANAAAPAKPLSTVRRPALVALELVVVSSFIDVLRKMFQTPETGVVAISACVTHINMTVAFARHLNQSQESNRRKITDD